MEIDDIENKIACNELTAAQVFTQMKQHIKECKCTSPLIEKKDDGANVPLDRLVSTKYVVQVSAGDKWLHSNAHSTLKEARKEKARMDAISGHARRIIRQSWTIVEC